MGRSGIEALADDVGSAITSLNFQVGQANNALTRIDETQKALEIASAVLAAAASVAASVGTGNWLGAATSVIGLADSIHKTLAPPDARSPAG